MITPHRRNRPGSILSLQMVWGAITASVVAYGVMAFLVGGAAAGEPTARASAGDPFSDPIVLILHVVGLGALAAGYFIPRVILRAAPRREPGLMPPEEGRFVVVPEIMRYAILRFALLETPAVLGLVLAIARREPLMFVLLGLASLAALFLAFPSDDRIRRIDATLNEPR